jgi:hypothetical protein
VSQVLEGEILSPGILARIWSFVSELGGDFFGQLLRGAAEFVAFCGRALLSGFEYLCMRGVTLRVGLKKETETGKSHVWSKFVVNGIEDEASTGSTVSMRRDDDRPFSFR